jgi:PRTRC genetic system protein A
MLPIPVVGVPLIGALAPLEFTAGSLMGVRYLLANNGLWREIRTPWLHATVHDLPAPANAPLPYGPLAPILSLQLPKDAIQTAISSFLSLARQDSAYEARQDFRLSSPDALEPGRFEGSRSCDTVTHAYDDWIRGEWLLDIHSHGHDHAFFSSTDNKDDRHDIKLAVVVGRVQQAVPEIVARLCLGQGWYKKVDTSAWLT